MKTSVIIATHNRRDDLRRTLRRLRELLPLADEILVCCDGCSDGTASMVREQFPEVILLENNPGRGSVASRCRLMEAASGEIVFSFDDDSYPLEQDFVEKVRELFRKMPRLAIASFPQRTDEFPETLVANYFGASQFVATYAASAAAFRISAYEKVPGWHTAFHHAYEEPDLALQMMAGGWMVYFYTGVTVRHHYSPANRNEVHVHHCHARNEQWSIWMRCPFPQLVVISLYRAFRQLSYAGKRGAGWLTREPQWWVAAIKGLRGCLVNRTPVSWSVYLAWLRLFRRPIATEKEWLKVFQS